MGGREWGLRRGSRRFWEVPEGSQALPSLSASLGVGRGGKEWSGCEGPTAAAISSPVLLEVELGTREWSWTWEGGEWVRCFQFAVFYYPVLPQTGCNVIFLSSNLLCVWQWLMSVLPDFSLTLELFRHIFYPFCWGAGQGQPTTWESSEKEEKFCMWFIPAGTLSTGGSWWLPEEQKSYL